MRTKRAFLLLSIVLLIVTISLTFFTEQHKPTRASGNGFPYVSGTQLIDASGNPLILRGTQVETSFMYASSWKTKNNVTRKLNPTVFYQMTTNWHMNVLRLYLSNWIYHVGAGRPLTREAKGMKAPLLSTFSLLGK